ncbi:MAG: N-acetyl-gamma-glutamyl-phosphate reductase [Leptospiraceae bacterium]|nr:N-acetyl-gamma-glutamyl-phosphate reductase [Leptospiraceae bacterium]
MGAGGLTGKELLKLLKNHPDFELSHITSNKTEGKTIGEVFPELGIKSSLKFQNHNSPIPKESLVVLAVPNEVSLDMTPSLLDKGHKVIDISGAYRLHDKTKFEKFYKLEHKSFDLMDKVVFGIPEIFREKLLGSDFVSNPGCYATSVILPIFLLGDLRKKIGSVVVNSASGVSGAGGRTEDVGFTFTNTYENFRAYKILNHQHTPEMEEYAFFGFNNPPEIIFTPHLLPVYRGILSTFVIQFKEKVLDEELKSQFSKFSNEPFIRFMENPEDVELKFIQNSNNLDIGFRIRENTLVIVSALDNLQKGAAGQALQNMNLMCNFKETSGLIQE